MAKRDYTETPPAHFGKIFIKNCMNCDFCEWHPKYWHICVKHNFRFGDHGGTMENVCGSWEISGKLLEIWKGEKR